MGKNWKKWAEKKGLLKWFQKENLIVLVLTGILLIIIALPTSGGREGKQGEGGTEKDGLVLPEAGSRDTQNPEEKPGEEGREADTDREYAAYLEEQLTELLSQMAGVGRVRVMITLKTSKELVVEKEQPVRRSTTNENDAQGGSRIVSEMDSEENTVYRTEGSDREPYIVMTLPPRVEGVVVVAEGAGNGTVNRSIVEIVQALFGVEAHKVRVVRMEGK